jgi:hypothetical protein
MNNEQLPLFFDMDNISKIRMTCKIATISEEGMSQPNAALGLPAQRFYTVTLLTAERPNGDGEVTDISVVGFTVRKTFFELTHPSAFALISEWKAMHVEGLPYTQTVTGFIYQVDTKRDFVQLYRNEKGELAELLDRVTKKKVVMSSMRFFLLEGEKLTGELRRRGTNSHWADIKERTHAVGEAVTAEELP